jgi:hypothetical protein
VKVTMAVGRQTGQMDKECLIMQAAIVIKVHIKMAVETDSEIITTSKLVIHTEVITTMTKRME